MSMPLIVVQVQQKQLEQENIQVETEIKEECFRSKDPELTAKILK
jgi:hypothetical protein